MCTPSAAFSTQPVSVFLRARPKTNGRKPTPWTTPRTRIEQAVTSIAHADGTATALPANLHDDAIYDQNRYEALGTGKRFQPLPGGRIAIDVVFVEFDASPFEPLAHALRVLASRAAEQLVP